MAADTEARAAATGSAGRSLCLPACLLLQATALALARPLSRYNLLPPLQNETFLIHFNPPSIDRLKVHSIQSVYFNCTQIKRPSSLRPTATTTTAATSRSAFSNITKSPVSTEDSSDIRLKSKTEATNYNLNNASSLTTTTTAAAAWGQGKTSYWAMIFSSDEKIAQPLWTSDQVGQNQYPQDARLQALGEGGGAVGGAGEGLGTPRYLVMEVWEGQQHNFSIQALHVGRVTVSLAMVDKDSPLLADNGQLPRNTLIQPLSTSQFPVTTMRVERIADQVFDSSAAAIAILITFGIGCCTDTESVKKQLKFPVSLIIGFCCQFILMPVLAFGLAMILPLEKDIRFGLLCTACVPGGGLGHIAVIIGDADIPLSLTMNLISVVAMLGTAPLWIFVLGQYFQTDSNATITPRIIPIYNFEIWLASIFLAYATGLVVNRFRPVVAEILLTWVIKPFLLLATILYITVGVYINMYVFEIINYYAVLGAILLPLIGCLLGFTLAAICRQKTSFVKTIALETSSLNCLIVLAALRFSLEQPDADLASTIPIWVMFTIPGMYVALAILQRFYRTVLHYWNTRLSSSSTCSKESPTPSKDYDVAAAIVSRPGIAALSAPLVVSDGADEDSVNNEKVTVL